MASRKRIGSLGLLGYVLTLIFLIPSSEGLQICEQRIAKCEGDTCFKSIPCYHGDCTESGQCNCDFCWEGENCQDHVDNFLPEFITAEETVIVSNPRRRDIIYIAEAYDSDLGTTCPTGASLCDCAEISYAITAGDADNLFYISNLTGEIYVKEPLQVVTGKVYNLTITAFTTKGNVSPSPNSHLELKVVIDDVHHHLQPILGQNSLPWQEDEVIEFEILSRKKRNAEDNSFTTEFNFTLINGDLADMKVGRRLDYRLEILIPKTEAMDLIVEVFTKEVGNSDYTPVLAVFDAKLDNKPDGVTFSEGDEPKTEMLLSDKFRTVYDRCILTFGEVQNTNDNPTAIYVLVSVTQVKNPETRFEETYFVIAGAEFDKETYVWVGLSEVTVHDSSDKGSIEVEVDGPTEIPLDSAGVYMIITYCAVRSDNFTYKVIGPDEKEVVSIGNLGVKNFDKNYAPVPQSVYHYNTTKEGSDDTVIYTEATMNVGIMTNVGNSTKPRDEGNIINVTFAIYALNYEENVDKEVEFTTTVTVGEDVLPDKPFKVKLVPRKDADKMVTIHSSDGNLTTTKVGVGDMAMYTLWFNLTSSGYADFVVEISIPDVNGIPRLEACSARLWQYDGSFDVTYLNTTFIDPEITDGKFFFKFHRIHVTDQRTPPMYEDTMMKVHVIMKVSTLSANKAGESIDPELKVGSQGSADTTVPVGSLTIIEKKIDYVSPTMAVKNGVAWDYLYLGGAIVLNITMTVPPGRGYAEVFMEASGENNPQLPAVHICRAELGDVGRNLPCLRIHQDEVNEKFVKYAKTDPANRFKPDMTSIMLGDVGSLPVKDENFADVSVIVALPENSTIKDDDLYPISAGLLISANTIWSAIANYTMKEGAPPDLKEDRMPEASAYQIDDKKIVPGHFAEVEVQVDTKIQSISAVQIELEGGTTDVSLCSLKVKSYGRNLPCVDMTTEPFYETHENELDGNKIAGMKFSALSNVGFRPNEEDDRLTLVALVRIAPSCTNADVELLWRVIFGGGKKDGTVIIQVDPDGDASDSYEGGASEPKALAFKPVYADKAIGIGSPVVVDFEVSLETGTFAPVTVQIKNVYAEEKFPYDMCLGGIWFRGKNYPCFSPKHVESSYSSSSDSRNDTAVYNLGLVCNTFIDKEEEEENKVTVRVAMRPVDDGSVSIGDSFSIEGYVTVGSNEKLVDTLEFTIEETPDEIETEEKPTAKLLQEIHTFNIRQRMWIPFNITIPVGSLLKVSVEAKAPVKDDRAVLTVYNIRLKSGGINIPCPSLYPQPKVTLEASTPTTQKDIAKAEIGYFTNLGLTHKTKMDEPGDDDLTIEVEVEMSDHPLTEHEEQFKLNFIVKVGETDLNLEQIIEVKREGDERADFDVNVVVDSSKIYQRGEKVDVTVTVLPKNESRAEPINTIIRFFLPPYVEYDDEVFKNVTVVGDVEYSTEYGGLDIKIPQFLFSDSVTITFNLLADPKDKRGFGKGEINATTPYVVLCAQSFREKPTKNPSAEDKIINCGPVGHILYMINSEECYNALELNKLDECQLSASSAAKKDWGPHNIGKGGDKGWSPALRLGPLKPYIQVDFLRTTRVSRLEFLKVGDMRSVSKYRLQYGHTGSDWMYANEVTDLTYENGAAIDDLEKPVQTRFVRVVVEESEEDEEDAKYIRIQMEMYGCYTAEKLPSVACSKTDPTWYSDDNNQYGRHFSVDTEKNIIYFCDLEYDMKNLVCFSSANGGSTWQILPRGIGGVLGYDTDSHLTYAFDKRKRAYVATDDGIFWIPVDATKVNDTVSKDTFSKSKQVPAYTREDIKALETNTGSWEASFDGLIYEGNADPRARWSRCCKTK